LRIAAGPDGNLWFTDLFLFKPNQGNVIGPDHPHGHGHRVRDAPEHPVFDGITAGPDGNVWYADTVSAGIGRITPTGTTTLFGASCQTYGITSGPDGNLWFIGGGLQHDRAAHPDRHCDRAADSDPEPTREPVSDGNAVIAEIGERALDDMVSQQRL